MIDSNAKLRSIQMPFCSLMHIHSSGKWEPLATGTLELVNIRVSDIKHIALKPL